MHTEIPRYAPEADLPAAAYLPGLSERPPHPPAWPDAPLREAVGYRYGVDLFNHGFYWEAHEAWETLWLDLSAESADRAHLQGLIQAAAALLKLRLGAAAPARTIWARGRARLEPLAAAAGGLHLGIALPALLAAMDAAVGAGTLPDPPPRIRLR